MKTITFKNNFKFLSLLLTSFLIVSCSNDDDGSSNTVDTQYEVMLAFNNANPDMNTVSWNPDETDVALWQGVTVNSDGYITGINITGPSGTPGSVYFRVIPPEIAQLEYLTELVFVYNEISSVPEEIAQLSNLTLLDLRGNNISTIPQAVCNMETDYGTSIQVDAEVTCE